MLLLFSWLGTKLHSTGFPRHCEEAFLPFFPVSMYGIPGNANDHGAGHPE
jgi:hypothetical protein